MMDMLILFTLSTLVMSFVFSVIAIGVSLYTLKIATSAMASRDLILQKEQAEELAKLRRDMVDGLNSYSQETVLAAERAAKEVFDEYVSQPQGDLGGFGTF